MANPIGQVPALSATDKLPSTALQTIFGVGGNLGNQIRYLMIIAASASGGGTLIPDTEAKLIISDGDEDGFYGDPGSEGARMVRMARKIDGIQIKCCTPTQSGGAAATAQIVIDGPWSTSSTGPIRFRVGGQPVERSVLGTDDPQAFAEGLADQINLDGHLPVTAEAAAGVSTEWIVYLTWKSDGARGNDAILWKNDDYKPSGMTVTLGGDVGGTVTSDPGPWILPNAANLVIAFNVGGNQTFAVACTAAVITGSGETYSAVTAGHVLNLTITDPLTSLPVQRQVVFAGTENSQTLFHAAIQAVINGIGTVTNSSGHTRITSNLKGSDAVGTIDTSDSDVLASLGLTASSFVNGGPNNVANANGTGVTAAEWVTIATAITNGTATATTAGALNFTSATTGPGGTVQVQSSSTADTPMGFDNSVHTGGSGAGPSVASGGVRFTGGAATENLTTLLTTLETEPFWTGACAVIDATNLARLENFVDTQAGALVREFHDMVVASTKAFASSTSLSQTTLDNQRFQMLDMEEGETPAEEQAAWMAALRHQKEQSATGPNQKYDGWPTPFVPQEASSKRMSRSRQVAALDVGLTPIPTKNNVAYVPRAITTRSLTALGGADDGTIDVGQARTPDVINEQIGALWEAYTDAQDDTAHHKLRNDPAPGEEADIPAGITYPKDWQREVTIYMQDRAKDGWVVEVDAHPTVVGMHPTSSTPRFVQYTPVIVAPPTHQLEGTIAQTKFVAT